MPNFGWKQEFRDNISDAWVVETFDRLGARLNGFLADIGRENPETGFDNGADDGNLPSVQDFLSPFKLPVRRYNIASDYLSLDPGTAAILRLNPVIANRSISGIKGGSDGRIVELFVPRSAGFTVTLKHADSNAIANRRLDLVGAADLSSVVGKPRAWRFWYDTTDNIWQMLGGSAAIAVAQFKNFAEKVTQVATGADTNETTLWEGVIPASTLSKTGDMIHVRAFGHFSLINSKTLKFYFDEVEMTTTAAQGWDDRGWQMHVLIQRRSEDVQAIHAQFVPAQAGLASSIGDFVVDAADESADINFKITGTNSTANAGDITFEGGHAFKVGAA
ncbi:hypothetical protein LCGC14_1330700 [marine sediment metagenome]|uniref:Uncharacterized protein n=1 Tax=marine sediment metagenome TaxID=412755 RepID=A0A0F9L2Q2_9ZZZZ